MKRFTNSLLGTVDQLSGRLGPLATVADRVVSHVVPQMSAQACYPSGTTCCGVYCTYGDCDGGHGVSNHFVYVLPGHACSSSWQLECVACGLFCTGRC